MFDLFYFFLGLIQGLTEFLPVSSSGHLALAQIFFSEIQKESLLIEITAHFGSLLAIGFYYRNEFFKSLQSIELGSQHKEQIGALFSLFLSTLPAGFIGLFFKDAITAVFLSPKIIALGFVFTSAALVFSYYYSIKLETSNQRDWPTPLQALFIGAAQALALMPGVSRSGSTIAAGLIAGLKPKQSALFSFCSVAPLILAASLLSVYKVTSHAERLTQSENPLNLSVLLISSFFFGWLGLSLVVKFLERNRLHYFAAYLLPLALFLTLRG
jgi:undecaprenyl-diphosphatase